MTTETKPKGSPLKVVHASPARRGGARVVDDKGRGQYIVRWRSNGTRRTKRYRRSEKGLTAAKAFVLGLTEGITPPLPQPGSTTAELWRQFKTAEFYCMRETTRRNYLAHWGKWEQFINPETPAASVTLGQMDLFRDNLLRFGHVSNQVQSHLRTVKRVYRWARGRGLIETKVPDHEFKVPKNDPAAEPEEYTDEQYDKLIAVMSQHSSRTWRVWAVATLLGHQGVRINAALNLRWEDIDGDYINWPAATDKLGRSWRQPLMDGTRAALLTAWHWREHDGYDGPFVFYTPRKAKNRQRRADAPYTASAFIDGLHKAERRAGITPKELRASHGLRKMVAGDVLEETKDAKLALDFIGDKDPKQMARYLKRRTGRLEEAARLLNQRRNTPKGAN
jgi:integrase